jgi:hypothetical protein
VDARCQSGVDDGFGLNSRENTMQAKELPFKPYCFPAIVEPIDDNVPFEGQRVRLLYENGSLEALTWIGIPSKDILTRMTANVTLVELPTRHARYLMMQCAFNPALQQLHLLHESLCPLPGVVVQTKALIDQIRNAPLRALVVNALTQRDAALGYWITPASLCDHHNYPGGLARHSLEVATMVSTSTRLPDEDRDLGVALALLHDYGKIWCYRNGKYTADHKRGHEVVGLDKLKALLEDLHAACPETGARMEELLGGLCQRTNKRYPLAIGRIVNAFDQMSCEVTRRREAELANAPF